MSKAKQVEVTLELAAKYSKHEYDIDAIEIYYQLKDLLEQLKPESNDFDKEKYLDGIRLLIKSYCQTANLDFDFFLKDKHHCLVIQSSSNVYFNFLVFALTYYDIHKIKRFLDYQKANFAGNYYTDKNNFTGHLEYLSYDSIKKLSLYKTDERLEKLMQWIEREREHEIVSAKEDEFYYWKYGKEKLIKLYQSLSEEKKIDTNENFLLSYLNQNVVLHNRTVWRAPQTQLVYLWYAIYDGVVYKGESIYKVIPRLFVQKGGRQLGERNLNSTYTNMSHLLFSKEKLPAGLASIKRLIDGLELNSASNSK